MKAQYHHHNRGEIRKALTSGRSRHVVAKLVIAWCRKNAAKSWDTAAIIQLMNIFKLSIRDMRALVSELHTGGTIHSPGAGQRVAVRVISTWSCDWDEKMLDIPAI